MMRLYKIRELADIGRVNEATIRRAIADGRLKAVRIGRVLRVTGEAFSGFLKPVVVHPSENLSDKPQEARK